MNLIEAIEDLVGPAHATTWHPNSDWGYWVFSWELENGPRITVTQWDLATVATVTVAPLFMRQIAERNDCNVLGGALQQFPTRDLAREDHRRLVKMVNAGYA